MKALTALCLLWAGLLAGVSFLATPIKFRAPSLTLPVALDVGRQTFDALNKVELGAVLLSITLLLLLNRRPPRSVPTSVMVSLGVAASIVVLQSVWLLPVLDARVVQILANQTPPDSPFHWIYIGLEAVKLGALVGAGMICLGAQQHSGTSK